MSFGFLKIFGGGDAAATLRAPGKSFAVIEFTPDGRIVTANALFCQTVGYDLAEIKGRHHSMFAPPGYAETEEYRKFWRRLGNGEYDAGEYQRFGKGGREIWLQASYTPVAKGNGNVTKVVKLALDITKTKARAARRQPDAGDVSQPGRYRIHAGG
jgi:methyl-accepting chemotaxis protein